VISQLALGVAGIFIATGLLHAEHKLVVLLPKISEQNLGEINI
jgi:hypothetical protein